MTDVKSYRDLIVWQKSIQLVKEIFVLTDKFPKSELYGIVAQMRRAGVSIPSNIAEGYGRKSPREYAQFLSVTFGSALELETQLIIAKELEFSTKEDFITVDGILDEVCRMLNSLRSKIRNNSSLNPSA